MAQACMGKGQVRKKKRRHEVDTSNTPKPDDRKHTSARVRARARAHTHTHTQRRAWRRATESHRPSGRTTGPGRRNERPTGLAGKTRQGGRGRGRGRGRGHTHTHPDTQTKSNCRRGDGGKRRRKHTATHLDFPFSFIRNGFGVAFLDGGEEMEAARAGGAFFFALLGGFTVTFDCPLLELANETILS